MLLNVNVIEGHLQIQDYAALRQGPKTDCSGGSTAQQ
jgi:hypothetical protein